MPPVTLAGLRERYREYQAACLLLASSHKTVAERRDAIDTRDAFEQDVREGILDELFDESENWL